MRKKDIEKELDLWCLKGREVEGVEEEYNCFSV